MSSVLSEKKILFMMILLSLSSVLDWCDLAIGNTFLWWVFDAWFLYVCAQAKPADYSVKAINAFLLMLLLNGLYGFFFQADNYWDYKQLVSNLMIFLLPISSYTFSNSNSLTIFLKLYLKYAPFLLIILLPFLHSDALGKFLVPYTFCALFFPLVNKTIKISTLIAFFIVLTLGNQSRSDAIKFSFCISTGLLLCSPLGSIVLRKAGKLLWITLLSTPILLFGLAASGQFNIFNIEEELGIEGQFIQKTKNNDEYSALVDTRTFIYEEAIHSALKHNYVVQGRSIARGYDSFAFMGSGMDIGHLGERPSSEASILNVFTYFGLIGVLLYFIIFATASYQAICKSKNIFVPIMGIYVAFRWSYGWVEDFSKFDLNYFFLWIFIGICFSPVFREMNDEDFLIWIKSEFA